MIHWKTFTVATVMAAGLFAGAAQAATVTFGSYVTTTDNAGPNPTPLVTVNDDTPGFLSFSVSSSGTAGNLSGVFFDISGIVLSISDIVSESVALAQFGASTGNVGGGVNMNGTYTNAVNNPVFDFGLRIAQTNVSVVPFTFQISSTLVALADLEKVGLRFQSVGDDGSRSAKLIGTPALLPPVPVPAAGLMLLGALGGLAALRRRRRTA